MPRTSLFAIAVLLLLAASLALAAAERPPVDQVAWGEPVHGLRLHVHLDREVYVQGRDLVNVSFTILNTTAKDFPGGRRLGERLAWNPDGTAVERTKTFDEFHVASGPRALVPGRYRVRAVYEVDTDAEAPFHYGIDGRRLESNVVAVEVAR